MDIIQITRIVTNRTFSCINFTSGFDICLIDRNIRNISSKIPS